MIGPRTLTMDRPGDQFLTRSRLAEQQDRRIRMSHLLDKRHHTLQTAPGTDDALAGTHLRRLQTFVCRLRPSYR